MADHSQKVEINGHQVDAHRVDQFRSGRTGAPLTDAQYDRGKAAAADKAGTNDGLIPEEHR